MFVEGENMKINKIIYIISFSFASCSSSDSTSEGITFIGEVEEINDSSILVTVDDSDSVGFDKASVSISDVNDISFNLIIGQKLQITIKPDIMETYPVQVVSTKIEQVKSEDE